MGSGEKSMTSFSGKKQTRMINAMLLELYLRNEGQSVHLGGMRIVLGTFLSCRRWPKCKTSCLRSFERLILLFDCVWNCVWVVRGGMATYSGKPWSCGNAAGQPAGSSKSPGSSIICTNIVHYPLYRRECREGRRIVFCGGRNVHLAVARHNITTER
eukprot:scaffold8252_cov226-Amphora_coffeaeformis.AAC.4